MWTGPSYYRTRGGYKKFGITAKVLLSISGIFLIVLALGQMVAEDTDAPLSASGGAPSNTTPSPDAAASLPNMQVQAVPGPITVNVQVTGDDALPFTVQRIVVNDRPKEKGCDSNLENIDILPFAPTKLKRGDATIFYSSCGSQVLSVDVYTNRGTASFKFNSDSK